MDNANVAPLETKKTKSFMKNEARQFSIVILIIAFFSLSVGLICSFNRFGFKETLRGLFSLKFFSLIMNGFVAASDKSTKILELFFSPTLAVAFSPILLGAFIGAVFGILIVVINKRNKL